MGLGGITRDSIADLASLVHDDSDKGEGGSNMKNLISLSFSFEDPTQPRTGSFAYTESSQPVARSGEAFLFLRDEGAVEQQCCVGLNDGDGGLEDVQHIDLHAGSPNSAANAHDVDSNQGPPPSSSAESPAGMYYQFQYQGYTDYYADDFSPYNYDYDGYSNAINNYNGIPGMQQKENKNIFCCFFAPWLISKNDIRHQQEQQEHEQQHQSQSLRNQDSDERELEGANQEQVLQQTATAQVNSLSQDAVIASETAVGTVPSQKPYDVATEIASSRLEMSDCNVAKDNISTDDVDYHSKSLAVSAMPDLEENSTAKNSDVKSPQDSSLPNNRDDHNKQSGIKSILKVKRCINRSANNGATSNSSNKIDQKQTSSPSAKRHLFPAYEPKNLGSSKKGEGGREERSVAFNPMARVLTIPSRKDVPLSQKVQVSCDGFSC
ncbi:hypothetical protein ACHAWX_004356 [Stephanocyclus meneghinianus]